MATGPTIIHEDAEYWVSPAKCGFEVWRVNGTHSVRCAVIGFKGEEGLRRAKAEISRRKALAVVSASQAS